MRRNQPVLSFGYLTVSRQHKIEEGLNAQLVGERHGTRANL